MSFAAIWKEYELLKTKGESIINSDQIMAMLKSSHLPTAIGIVCYWPYQTNHSIISKGNNQANWAARAVALGGADPCHPLQDIRALQLTSHYHPLTLHKFCPTYTISFMLIFKPCLHFFKAHL